MRASWFNQFGSASEVLNVGEFDIPEPSHGEVLIRMHSSGVNPSDTKKRKGSSPNILDNGPVIPNSDGAGIIETVGMGVPHSRIGERVWVYQAQFERSHGSAAEYLTIDSHRAVPLPDNTSFSIGSCIGIPAMTAHRCVFSDGPVDGKTLLITGGAGRVGHYAIQLAKNSGATVITTASNEYSRKESQEAGADFIADHTTNNLSEQIMEFTQGAKIDRVIDVEFGANLEDVLEVIQVGGEIATYSSTVEPEPMLPFGRMMFMDLTVRMVLVYAMPEIAKQSAIKDITHALKNNQLQHRIASTYTLDNIAAANNKVEKGGFYGSVIVKID